MIRMLVYRRWRKTMTIFSVAAILVSGYFWYRVLAGNGTEPRYVLAYVKKGVLVTSVSGSGQISAFNQVDVKPKISGEVIAVRVKNGQAVKAGSAMVELNARDAFKAVRDAEVALETAKVSLEKLRKPADAADVQAAESAVVKARLDLEKLELDQRMAEEDLVRKRDTAAAEIPEEETDRAATILAAFADLPIITTGLEDILMSKTVNGVDENHAAYMFLVRDLASIVSAYRDSALGRYRTARSSSEETSFRYRQEAVAGNSVSDAVAGQIEATALAIAAAVETTNSFIDFVQDILTQETLKGPAAMATHQSSLDTYASKSNAALANIRTANRAVADARAALADAERNLAVEKEKAPRDRIQAQQAIRDKETALEKVRRGADALDVKSAELNVTQKENALSDARERLSDYTVRAPFDGMIAQTDAEVGDAVSSATALATLITNQKLAEISFNEVDAVKVKPGQKATLTFDAIPDLSMDGTVLELDAVGTASQGVVTYMAKIAFDAGSGQMKPGMSVAATVTTETKSDILIVPNAAVKSQNRRNYVEVVNADDVVLPPTATGRDSGGFTGARGAALKNSPRRQAVQTGIANDDAAEIISGLQEGDVIILNTITVQAGAAAAGNGGQTAPFRIPGGSGGGFRQSAGSAR
jgi:HlyD family secretion protein